MLDKECLFCKIIKKDLKSYVIYENDYVLAFLDIFPLAPYHTLVIPKKHFQALSDLDQQYHQEILQAIQLIQKKMMDLNIAKDFNIVLNEGRYAGQEVFHTHFHIIPRQKNDKVSLYNEKKQANDQDLEKAYQILRIQ